jgi:hypothetical protein
MYNLTVFTNMRNGEENISMDPDEVYLFTEAIEIMSETEHNFRRRRNVTEYEKFFPFDVHDDWFWPTSLHNMLKQWYSIEKVWGLMLSHERRTATLYKSKRLQYQRIGLFRSDVAYQNDINISDGDAILPLFNNYQGYMNKIMFYGLRNFNVGPLAALIILISIWRQILACITDCTLRDTCVIVWFTGRSQYNIETFVFIEFA